MGYFAYHRKVCVCLACSESTRDACDLHLNLHYLDTWNGRGLWGLLETLHALMMVFNISKPLSSLFSSRLIEYTSSPHRQKAMRKRRVGIPRGPFALPYPTTALCVSCGCHSRRRGKVEIAFLGWYKWFLSKHSVFSAGFITVWRHAVCQKDRENMSEILSSPYQC